MAAPKSTSKQSGPASRPGSNVPSESGVEKMAAAAEDEAPPHAPARDYCGGNEDEAVEEKQIPAVSDSQSEGQQEEAIVPNTEHTAGVIEVHAASQGEELPLTEEGFKDQ